MVVSYTDHNFCEECPMCPAVAYEMLVSHSPPVFSHSPPSGFLSDYAPLRLSSDHQFARPMGSCRSTRPLSAKAFRAPLSPKRPCLVIRPDDGSAPSSAPGEEDPTSPVRLKKKVVFADDKGMSLTHVRVMTEPSNVPPLWSYRFLAEVTQGLSAEPEAQDEPWEIVFPQPASDYMNFRKKLETKKVSLENVIVKETEETIVGTVKVSNISFMKEVLIRSTSDNWENHEDTFCTFVPSASSSANNTYVLYDTFSFKLPLRQRARKIEFCVCYRCENQEFWDNNDGKNYTIMKKSPIAPLQKSSSDDDIYKKEVQRSNMVKCADAAQAKLNSWSEFASWTHLETPGPYW